jgi:raffinose/stachyose/melibiose transport system permease protein
VTQIIFALLVVSMIIPFQALMIPFVSIYGRLDLLNSTPMLIYFYLGFGVSLSTFLYYGFMSSIPMALDESAAIEGAGPFQTFWYVVFPLLRPIATTIMILNALWIWNDFLLPSLVLFQESRTLPLMTFSFYGQYTSQYGLAMAGLVLSTVPIIVFYLILQRNIIRGITEGAVK